MPITLGLTIDGGDRPRQGPALGRVLRMLERLREWAAARAGKLADVYLVRGGDSVALYLMTRGEAYDFQLGRALAEFAAPYLARGVISAATLVPAASAEEVGALFDPQRAFRITFE